LKINDITNDNSRSRRQALMDSVGIVPRRHEDVDVYLILDELSSLERVWRELSNDEANKQTIINMISEGQFHRPMRIVVFNTDEGWSRDETHDIDHGSLTESDRLGHFESRCSGAISLQALLCASVLQSPCPLHPRGMPL
jgi:hypothetical protein